MVHFRPEYLAHFPRNTQLYSPAIQNSDIFDDFEAMTVLVQKSFANAAKKAVAENDALGIPTPYSKNGKIFYREPHKAPNKLCKL